MSDHEHHDHDHPHEHDHEHDGHPHDEHDHDHSHDHGLGIVGILREMIPGLHGHKHGEVNIDSALEGSDRGIWALKVSLAVLGVTALIQLVIVLMSGSVGLLADMIHNFSDALTA